ncbi:MAG TPA: hypothetical protein VFA27_15975 [Vicinamibacterales bacterium]|nr:hypothetical protein [Vicinamibacterales bacterium]
MSVGRIACVHVRRPGWFAVAALLVGLSPTTVAAQQKAASVALPPDQIATTPAIARPSTFAVGSTDDDPVVAARRFQQQLADRIRPLEERFRDDARLQGAGALVALGAVALGAVRGQGTLTFIGAQALRLGLEQRMTATRRRAGVSIEPSIGYRRVSVTVSRTFH